MTEKSCPFEAKPIEIRYDFDSVSDEKTVRKTVIFSRLTTDLFNVALLDVLEYGLLSDDLVMTNNQDLRTVMAAVIRVIDSFLKQLPGKIVGFQGSGEQRTRLYRVVIGREPGLISQQFRVEGGGGVDGDTEPFVPDRPHNSLFISKI